MAVQHPLAGSNALAWPQLRNERFIVSMSAIGTERRREQLAELQRRITEADQRLGRLFDAIKAGMVPESRAILGIGVERSGVWNRLMIGYM